MTNTLWSLEDATVTAQPDVRIETLLEQAHAHGLHMGTRTVHHATLADAVASNDPIWSHRVVVALVEGPWGTLSGPIAPRSAVGPDLACFALGTRTPLEHVTLRAEQAPFWGGSDVLDVDEALRTAEHLSERGCTLVELRPEEAGFRVHAALPRRALRGALPDGDAPAIVSARSLAAWPVPWVLLRQVWTALSSDLREYGALHVEGLDPHLALVRLVATEGSQEMQPALARALLTRHLGVTTMMPPEVLRALRLRLGATGRARA